MDNIKATKNQEEKTFPATVVKVIDDCKVVINRGALHKVTEGQRFLLYKLSEEEIKDPISGESLGYLEIVKGTGKVVHVQERISTIESDNRERWERKIVWLSSSASLFSVLGGGEEEETIVPSSFLVPFDGPIIGDRAKPI